MITECDSTELEIQIPLFDLTDGASSPPRKRNRVIEKTLAHLRQLHDELNQQLYNHPSERPMIQSPADVAQLFIPFLGSLDHEELWVACLDTRNRLMCLVALYKGSVNTSQVRVGEVFRQAIIENATAIVVGHSHPSGDPTPSIDDVSVTHAIVQVGKLLDVDVLDHLIIAQGSGKWVSMKERSLGFT